jgi:hypothetical protein
MESNKDEVVAHMAGKHIKRIEIIYYILLGNLPILELFYLYVPFANCSLTCHLYFIQITTPYQVLLFF